MKEIIPIILILLIGCTYIPDNVCLSGSGNVIEETRDVTAFDSIELRGQGNLHLTQGGSTGLTIEAEDNIIPEIETTVSRGKLIIEQKTLCIRNSKPIDYHINIQDVKLIAIAGSGDVIGVTNIDSDDLELIVSGSGDLDLDLSVKRLSTTISGSGDSNLRGTADEHTYLLSGSGSLNALDLTTQKTSAQITGSGSADIYANDELDITVSGSGKVRYKGDPQVSQTVSGSGSVKPI